MIINIIILVFFLFSIYFTIKYKFMQLKSPFKSYKIIVKDKSKSSYQTFMVLLASHIGTGNIVGITSALIVGGPGSLFWMWIYAIFASILSLIENTLAQVYKEKIDNENRGGSSYYIFKGLGLKKLALVIAFFLMLSNTIFFQPLQVNTISETIIILTNTKKIIIFIFLLGFTFLVIFRGTKTIVHFSEFIVPIMSITYILLGLFLIVINIEKFPSVIKIIIEDAFKRESILGGVIFVGFKRSLFSHEAGLGTMPTISAMDECDKPINQGFISCFGVFIDTIVMCSLTGFMILLYNVKLENSSQVELIINVFKMIFGKTGVFLASFFMLTFAFATFVSQFYLGESNLLFLTKDKESKRKVYSILYKILFIMGIFLGVYSNTNSIWNIIDIGMILLGIINLYAICKLSSVFKREIK
ncbi:MAG: alanine:cation symporter family protein [Coprobacillus sp.]|nr:alanine:cation symporter family protein [Coprobacillus sp.]MDY4145496.1 amino acid carrier protein [Bacilli bacterium]